jgi:Ca2+-binding EF-hand superfamily protein
MLKDHYQQQEIEELTQAAFEMFDEDRNHALDDAEYKKLLQHLGQLEQQNGAAAETQEELDEAL